MKKTYHDTLTNSLPSVVPGLKFHFYKTQDVRLRICGNHTMGYGGNLSPIDLCLIHPDLISRDKIIIFQTNLRSNYSIRSNHINIRLSQFIFNLHGFIPYAYMEDEL